MIASVTRLGLNVSSTPIVSTGSWVRNASLKAEFLFNERRSKRGPLLYVDVDAVFHRDPWPALAELKGDVAVYYEPSDGRLIAATILINDTPAAQQLMEAWKDRCNSNPDIWDQVVLQEIIEENAASGVLQIDVRRLSSSFCWIFDRVSNEPVETVYIEQLQASREATRKKRWFGRINKRLARRRERVEEIERILFAPVQESEFANAQSTVPENLKPVD
ncbi:glycosyltransferase family 77 protein [Phyllobacterium sp. 628]|nr:glycosyltransferase family 77 protein [Phyllobacterium sp. 628]